MTNRENAWSIAGFALMSLLVLGEGCTPAVRNEGTVRDTSSAGAGTTRGTAADTALVASLERGPCRGFCPTYRVDVYADGRVKFDGTRNVQSTGPQRKTISSQSVQGLARAIESSGFASADTAYMFESPGCGQYHTDLPVSVLSARVGARMKTIRHDPGCQSAPGFLKSLAARIDSVAGTSLWITGKETGR
jgi:hypothetical protein